jgi:hypothetical protein
MKKPMSRPFSGDELTQQINHIHIFNPKFCSVIFAKMLELEQTHPNLDAAFKS